jgi:hypothetical protein
MDLELAPVGVGELAKRLIVALCCASAVARSPRILAWPVPFIAVTTNDPKRGRKESGGQN